MKILHRFVSLSRIVTWLLIGLAGLIVVLVIAGLITIRTQRFRDYVRRRIVEQVETATNGRFEYGRFIFNWETLTAQMGPVVLHGKETEGAPLVAVDSLTLGLRIISLFEHKVDLAGVRLERPRVRVVFYADGTTNIPEPHRKTTWAEDVVNLAVRDYEAVDGSVEYDETRIPLDVRGEGLRIRMSFDAARQSYSGDLASDRVQLKPLDYGPVPAALSAAFTLESSRLEFSRVRISTRESRIDAAGALENIRVPHGTFTLRAALSAGEAVRILKLPAEATGAGAFDGKLTIAFAPVFDFGLTGKLAVKKAGFSRGSLHIADADVQTNVSLTLDRLALDNIEAHALGARVRGNAAVSNWRDARLSGEVDGVNLRDAVAILAPRPMAPFPWTAEAAGPFSVEATLGAASHFTARTNLALTPGSGGVPVSGDASLTFDSRGDSAAASLALGPSWIATAATRLDASGTPGQTLRVKLHSTDLDDLLPALALASSTAPQALPIQLSNGTADVDGSITGPLDSPAFEGHVAVANASIEGHAFSNFSGDVRASKDQVQATRFTLARGATTVAGSAMIGTRAGSFDDASIAAQLEVRNAAIPELLREAAGSANVPGDIAGTASGSVRVTGTIHKPEADVTADIQHPAAFGEQADRLRATVRYTPARVAVSSGDVTMQNSSIRFSGGFQHPENDWKNGQADFDVSTTSLPTSRIQEIARLEAAGKIPPVDAALAVQLRGAASVANGTPTVTALNGTFSARSVALYRQMVGEISAAFETRNADLAVQLNGKVREASFEGSGAWRLNGDQPGSATVRVSRLSVASAHSLAMLGVAPQEQQSALPFEGFVEGSAVVTLPLRKPEQVSADVTLSTVQFSPKPAPQRSTPAPLAAVPAQDLVVRNSGPVTLQVSANGIRIQSAQFLARDTSLAVSGLVPLGTGSADVSLRGNINLAILQLLNPSLLAKGTAALDASVRGAWRNPALNGRMQLSNASLYLTDLPNGVDNANGTIVFDRNRATIERLTAETGGGRLSFGGALEFGEALVYRLQADAQQVRVRYPDDVSTTFNAHLELNGTPDASTLSGTVTLNRTALNPRTDLGRLMSAAARPSPAPATPNEYLRGMQLDVRVESGATFEFDTALARDVQTTVDLRLRGTPLQPLVLGSVSVNEGEVQLFGNRYTIDRGDIRFLNPVKIEPVLDMSLETKARGIAVNVSLSGTLQKLKVNYSSDPPLQPSEIIALLAVGRDPSQTAGIANPSASSTTGFVEAGGGLLGEAVSQQLSSRLQRFFGASRVKIDPTLTGVDNLPQARLTLEQQVSKDITVTYITNLNYTQEQAVRLQWDFDRNWSAVAVRDASGLFGIDVQYRRRF